MPEYLSPGVYVEEVDTGNKPIEGVATSTVGFLGISERGPVTPTLVTSFSEYRRVFGSYLREGAADRYLTYAAEGFFQNGGKRCFVNRVTAADAVEATQAFNGMTVSAIGPGLWGNRIQVEVAAAGLNDPALPATDPANLFFKLIVRYWAVTPPVGDPTLQEDYDNLSPLPESSSFYKRQVNGSSTLVELEQTAPGRPANAGPTALANGADGTTPLALLDFRNSLLQFEAVDEIAILCCPEEENFNITDDLVTQCENLQDRFAIIQARQTAPAIAVHRPTRVSKYAAYYYPWLRIRHPVTGIETLIPPGGHIAGIYARSDIERGVHKAPANEVIRGLLLDPLDPARGLQVQVTKAQQDLLNPRGVNVLRNFPGRGNLVWGARTSASDPDWKYVNVRRLFIFVEESIEEATQWVVFEPNDEPLWARVRRSVSDFLTRLWMDGMLQGKTKEEAYFVKCDRTTMTQADIDNGKLIMLIGIAPVKPAEFVIFRIGQWTGGSDVTEG